MFSSPTYRQRAVLSVTFILLAFAGLAQRTVQVKVTDSSTGEAIPSLSISLKGSTKGTLTDNNGQYSIEVPSDFSVLVFNTEGMYRGSISSVNPSGYVAIYK